MPTLQSRLLSTLSRDRALALLVGVLLLAPLVFHQPYLMSVWTFIVLNLIVIVALDVLLGYAGQLSLGQGVFVTIGAYASAILTTKAGWSGWAAIPVGMIAAGLAALIIAGPTLRLKGYYLAMVTLGFPIVLDAFIRYFSEFTGGSSGVVSIPRLSIGGYVLRDPVVFYYVVLAAFLVVLGICWLCVNSRHGLILKAIHADEALAMARGVNVAWVKAVVFAGSAMAAALSGSLYVHYVQFVAPDTFGLLYSIMAVVMLVIGGMGRLWGSIIGVMLLMWLPELLRSTTHWEPVIFGAALAAIMLFAPAGIAGLFRRTPILGYQPAPKGAPAAPATALPDSAPLLRIDGLQKSFGGVTATSDVSFDIRPREIKALIGPNGAGKSTLLALISGNVQPNGGRIEFGGEAIEGQQPFTRARAGISRTFQSVRLISDLTLYENVYLGVAAKADDSHAQAAARIRQLGLHDAADLYPGEVSQFQCRLTEIGAALAAEPRLLLLDEPAAGLSDAEIDELRTIIRAAREQGASVLLVDHVMKLVMSVADSVVVLDYGRKIAEDKPAAILKNPSVREAYLGTKQVAAHA